MAAAATLLAANFAVQGAGLLLNLSSSKAARRLSRLQGRVAQEVGKANAAAIRANIAGQYAQAAQGAEAAAAALNASGVAGSSRGTRLLFRWVGLPATHPLRTDPIGKIPAVFEQVPHGRYSCQPG